MALQVLKFSWRARVVGLAGGCARNWRQTQACRALQCIVCDRKRCDATHRLCCRWVWKMFDVVAGQAGKVGPTKSRCRWASTPRAVHGPFSSIKFFTQILMNVLMRQKTHAESVTCKRPRAGTTSTAGHASRRERTHASRAYACVGLGLPCPLCTLKTAHNVSGKSVDFSAYYSMYLYSGFLSPSSVFSYSVNPTSTAEFSLCRFSFQHANP